MRRYYKTNLLILCTTIFLAGASWNQIVPYLSLFLKDLGVSDKSLVSWTYFVFTMQATAGIVCQPFWGKVGDAHGRKPMVLRAGVCLVFIYIFMSICRAPWQLALLRFLNGALTGFVPGSIALIATNTPKRYAPGYVALAQAAMAAGLILGPAYGGFLAEMFGYRVSMRIAACAIFFSVLLVVFFVREPNKTRSEDKTSLWQDFATAFKSKIMLPIFFTVWVAAMFSGGTIPVITLYLKGIGNNAPGWLIGIIFALPAIAVFLTARRWTALGENIGYYKVIFASLLGTGIFTAILATPAAGNLWSFSLFFFVAGVFCAAAQPATSALICLRVEDTFQGRAYGIQHASSTFGTLVMTALSGVIAAGAGLKAVFVFIGAVFTLGFFILGHLTGNGERQY
ncbi:MAG: MFS transporter [Abditibacteriota bacterium]|nr:MFS transporter [Abditibacteriota bacterium]